MEKGTAARQAVVAECGFNRLLRRHRELWEGYRIENLSKHTYAVRSPGSERTRIVKLSKHGWSCKCPYATFRKFHCKHIRAVEALCLLPDPEQRAPTVLDPIPENTCPSCGADGATKAGVRKNKNYRNQIYKCRGCKKRFSANSGFERLCGPPTIVCRAIDDFFCGKSTGKIARGLEDEMEHAPKQQTVSNWIRRYSAALGFFTSTLKPRLGDKCRSDGMLVKVRGRQRYMHMTIDSFTRLWTAYTITPNKATDDISCLLRASARVAGKIPLLFVTDYDKAYHKAWLKEFRFNEDGKQTYHHRHVHAHWDINNNKMERFNGTMRDFLHGLRGLQEDYSPLLEGLRVYYNHVRPHEGISEGTDEVTPGEAAGITVNGPKWKTLIQHAMRFLKKYG